MQSLGYQFYPKSSNAVGQAHDKLLVGRKARNHNLDLENHLIYACYKYLNYNILNIETDSILAYLLCN